MPHSTQKSENLDIQMIRPLGFNQKAKFAVLPTFQLEGTIIDPSYFQSIVSNKTTAAQSEGL